MEMNPSITKAAGWLTAVVLVAIGSATGVEAATALTGQIAIRPLTPSEITDYGLPASSEISGGLSAVGVGQPVYLEALVNIAIPASNTVSVTWTLPTKPLGSAALLAASPLGTNVPTYKMADRLTLKVASRVLLRPDITGEYTVAATITATGIGSTNVTQNISGSMYMGVQVCEFCHSGGLVAENVYVPWTNTLHASFFTKAINGLEGSQYSKNCISCHTVGYDTNALAVNGGFDDIAAQLGWTFPTVLTSGNWAAMPAALQNLANIQCENCHGAGSEHAYAFGNTNLFNWPRVGVSFGAGDCGQCHDAKPNYVKNAQWNNSLHAITTRIPSGPTRNNCVRCHTAPGFVDFLEGSTTTNTDYEAITCQACHDPHDASNPYQLRTALSYTLPDGTLVTNAGAGGFCMNCHHSRDGSATNNTVNFALGLPTWLGGSTFGPHDGPQGDMIEGVNAITYGQALPNSAHQYVLTNTCVDCHMQTVASTDPAFLKAGGHTFEMSYSVVTNGVTNIVDKVDVCVQCHGPITSFDFPVEDFDGDGIIEGVQTEVQRLLDRLTTLLPNTNGVVDGLVKTPSAQTNWAPAYLKAAYNWQFVNNDGSKGIHNVPFAVGLLKASIADLTGDANNDGLPDWWQIYYFGSITNVNAAPDAAPAGDGVPNWLKYALGLVPTVPGIVLPTGVVWANGSALMNSATNTIYIYTAAEVAFDTQAGTTYQIQSISSLGGGWQNVGPPIVATNNGSMSYLTPTRKNVQQFFRVVHTP
jgi:hypothetical protein